MEFGISTQIVEQIEYEKKEFEAEKNCAKKTSYLSSYHFYSLKRTRAMRICVVAVRQTHAMYECGVCRADT